MFGLVAKPASPRRRVARRAGALLALLGVVLLALPIGTAQAAVRTAVGIRGTVLGRSGWYGTYTLPGIGTALCIDAGKAAPDSDFAYKPGATITGTLGAQLAYTAITYGGTTDKVTAVAAKLVLHDLQNAVYPYGALDVYKLQPSQLANFGGLESTIVSRARAVMTDVLNRYRLGPYRMTLSTPATPDANNKVPVTVTLLDGRGKPLAGFKVTLTGSNTTVSTITVTTGSTGKASATFTVANPDLQVRISARAVLPSPTPTIYYPTRSDVINRAQRVVIGGLVPLTQTTTAAARTVAPPPDTTVTVKVVKTGDLTAYYPIDGAKFELHAETPTGPKLAGPVTIVNGTATFPEVITTDLGSLWLVETVAPPGYAKAEPVAVPETGTPTVTVNDEVLPGAVSLGKTDALSGDMLAGAVLHVRYDTNNDGTFDQDLGTYTTTTEMFPVGYLPPGRYQITEEQAPPGYQLPADATQVATLEPGGTLRVTFADIPLTTVGFQKTPAGTYNPADYSLAGAMFVVTDEAEKEVGRCTTNAAGACTLPENVLLVGDTYCWTETVAPPGFTAADGDCFTAARRATMTLIGVAEQGTYVTIAITKHDTTPTGKGLPGATYELWLQDGDEPLATATTADDGTLRFPPQLPDRAYCVREIEAPPGYELDPQTHCTENPLDDNDGVAFDLVNARSVTESPSPSPSPSTAAPTPTVPPASPAVPEYRAVPELPRTGTASTAVARIGAACLLTGVGLLLVGSPRPRRASWATLGIQ